MTYIHCPDCDAVRTMDPAACPECGRCANCGEKVGEGVQNCECGFPVDEKLAKWIETRYGIADESVEQEKAKWQRLKKLEPFKRGADSAPGFLRLSGCIHHQDADGRVAAVYPGRAGHAGGLYSRAFILGRF